MPLPEGTQHYTYHLGDLIAAGQSYSLTSCWAIHQKYSLFSPVLPSWSYRFFDGKEYRGCKEKWWLSNCLCKAKWNLYNTCSGVNSPINYLWREYGFRVGCTIHQRNIELERNVWTRRNFVSSWTCCERLPSGCLWISLQVNTLFQGE